LNPSQGVLEKGSDEPISRGEINLAHELLGHGIDADNGKYAEGEFQGLDKNEYQASHRENQIRSELGKPLRTFYGTHQYIDEEGNSIFEGIHPLIHGTKSVYYPGYDYQKENPPAN
jgi:hypothetical protein